MGILIQKAPRWKSRGRSRLRLMLHSLCVFSVVLVGVGAGRYVRALSAGNGALPAYRDGVVLLAFRSGVTPARESEILAGIGAREIKHIGVGVHVVSVGHGRVQAAIQSLKMRSEVRYAEPDYVETVDAGTLPSDTFVGNQWAVQNTGQMVNGIIGTAGADERSLAAWGVTTGTNSVVVAVLDTGVQYSHPDLATNMWNNPGGIGGCSAGTHGYNVLTATCDPMDDDTTYGGHGSHVAGILGAVGNNAAGTAGVNWTTSIMAVKWVYGTNSGYTSDLITAMGWVIQAKQAGINVRVANDSATWPSTGFSQALSDEIDLLGANDILLVTAAGNTAQNNDVVPRYPCVYNRPTQICVAASDQNDNLWSSSNYGTTTVALAAPGVNVYSTLRQSNYGYVSGTSMAAPQVSGTAALILSLGYQPVSNLKSMILSNVDPLPSLTSYVNTGGRLNVCKAMPGCASASTGTPANSGPPTVTGIPQQGSVLGASTGIWSGLPTMYSYQWNRCDASGLNCSPIPNATSSNYASLASADAGATLSVTLTASNTAGFSSTQSSASAVVAQASSPFAIASTILDGSTISGTLQWMATPAQTVNFAQFYIDGVLSQTISSSPYIYNQSTTGLLDTTTLSNGTHVLGVRALLNDNRTYGFYGATVTVSNTPANTALPVISGTPMPGQTLSTSNGSWTNNPTTYAYQWDHCDVNGANCTAIPGAAISSYGLSSSDAGFTVRSSVTATNSAGSGTAVSAQTAVVPMPVPSITTTSLPSGTQNTAYSATLTATGGTAPYAWSVASGVLPSGLTLAASTGVISGTPTGAGTSSFTVQVTDANSLTATKALSLAINAGSGGGGGIALVQSNAQEGSYVGSLSAAFPTNNTPGNLIIAFVRMSTVALTVKVTDSAGNAYTDAVAQAQNTDGHQVHIFYAKNIVGGANTVTATFTSTNNHPWLAVYEYSGLSTTSPLDQTAHAQGSSATPNSGPTATTVSANELVFAATGVPAGYKGTATVGSGYTLLLQDTGTSRAANEAMVVNAAGSYASTFTLYPSNNWTAVVATFAAPGTAPSPPTIATTSLPSGTQNTAYSATLTATGGTAPCAWSLASGSLPSGLTLASSTGVISGTPTGTGTSSFTVQVTDANSQTATKALSLTINAGSGGGGGIALVQSNAQEGSYVGSLSAAFPTSNTAGNLIIAFVRMSTVSLTVKVTDSAGNTYTDAVAQAQNTDGHQVHIFYAKNIVGGANTVTATFVSTNNHPWLAVYEYSGLSTTSPLDQTAHAQGSSATPNSGPTATTASANELVFAATGVPAGYKGTVTVGSGYTLLLQDTGTSRAANEAMVVNATGSYASTFTLYPSNNWTAVVATFKQ